MSESFIQIWKKGKHYRIESRPQTTLNNHDTSKTVLINGVPSTTEEVGKLIGVKKEE